MLQTALVSSQWFLNPLSKQALPASSTAKAWFDRTKTIKEPLTPGVNFLRVVVVKIALNKIKKRKEMESIERTIALETDKLSNHTRR